MTAAAEDKGMLGSGKNVSWDDWRIDGGQTFFLSSHDVRRVIKLHILRYDLHKIKYCY